MPGGEQSSRHEDDDDTSSFWLVNDRRYPKMCGLWCGTFDAPDNLGKHFRDAPYYPLLKNDFSLLEVGLSSLEMRGPLIFRGPRPSGPLILNESYDAKQLATSWLNNLPLTKHPLPSTGSASTSTIKIKTEAPEAGVDVKMEAPAAASAVNPKSVKVVVTAVRAWITRR